MNLIRSIISKLFNSLAWYIMPVSEKEKTEIVHGYMGGVIRRVHRKR